MSAFLDHLFDPQGSGKKGRERIAYREKLKAHILEAPALRRVPQSDPPSLIFSAHAGGTILPTTEILNVFLGRDTPPEFFREMKRTDRVRPLWRLDGVSTEEQVLETRAMGADAYALTVSELDPAMLQFLVEVGRDYGLPAILRCDRAEDLALALRVQDAAVLWLREELSSDELLSWESLSGRTILWEHPDPLTLKSEYVCHIIQMSEPLVLDKKENAP